MGVSGFKVSTVIYTTVIFKNKWFTLVEKYDILIKYEKTDVR